MNRTSLGLRFVWASLAGAAVVALVTVALAVPLVRSVAHDQARAELSRAVDALAAAPRRTATLLAQEQRAVGPDDRSYAVVPAAGSAIGAAASVLSDAQLEELRSAGRISTSVRRDGQELLVEGRTVRRLGLAVVGVQPAAAVDDALGRLLRRIALALLAGLAVAVVAGLVLARRAAAPVRAAAERANRLASGERGLEPVPSPIAEVHEMNLALDALDSALATSEARQREFLLSISHELRTPLTALHGYAEALRDGAGAPGRPAEVGATLVAETERLDHFIADLLSLARLEADDFRLAPDTVDLGELLAQIVTAWRASAESCGVSLTALPPPGSGIAEADPMRVRQLLDGLVENALRATPTGGRVVLAARTEGEGVELTVTDSGPGLEVGEHEHAFERGYLRDRYAAHRDVGTGLGLSIARRLAQRMGGTLRATSGEAGGTVMTLRLEPGTAVQTGL
jgi:two-component system, OmpR family, sensor kinase